MKRHLLLLFLLTSAPAFAQDGAALYRRDCATCHDMGVDRAPARDALQGMTAERVLAAMESGPMISMASRDNGAERRAIAQYVTGKSLSARDLSTTPPQSAMCVTAAITPGNFANPLAGRNWNGWGDNTNNTRFQDANAAGFTAANMLKDLRLAQQAAGATAAATPLGAAAANLYQLYVDSGGGALDFSGIMHFISRAETQK